MNDITEKPSVPNESDAKAGPAPRRRRRWWRLQYGLRWLLLLEIVTVVVSAWLARPEWVEEPMLDGLLTLRVQVKRPGWFFMKNRGDPIHHGKAELRDAEGRILARGHYYDGVASGKWTYYDLQGRKLQEGKIVEGGIPIGPWVSWDPETGREKRRFFEPRQTDICVFDTPEPTYYNSDPPESLARSAAPGETLIVSNGRYAYLSARDETPPEVPPLDEKQLQELQRRLCDPAEERWDRSLQTLSTQGAAALPALTAGLQCDDPARRRACIRMLEMLGAEAMPAAEQLEQLSGGEDDETALAAASALIAIDAARRDAALEKLSGFLETGDPAMQKAARRAIVERFDLLLPSLEKLAADQQIQRRMQLLDLIEAYLADPAFEKVFFERRKEQCDRIFGLMERLSGNADRFVAGRARYLLKQRPLIEAPPAEDFQYGGGMGGGFM